MNVRLDPYTPAWMWSSTQEHSAASQGLVHTLEVVGIGEPWSEVVSADRLLVSIATFGDETAMESVCRSALEGALKQ